MWVIFFSLIATGLCAVQCPAGYTDNGSGVCVSSFKTQNKQFLAYNACARDNAYLDIITSSADNTQLQTRIGVSNYVWLGLTCTSNLTTSCVWDNGTPIKGGDFVNFKTGLPTPTVGACVALSGSDGKWYSRDCTSMTAMSRCTYSAGKNVPFCQDGSAFFRGNCYFGIVSKTENDASQRCAQDCGNLASIHSAGENSVVRDVASLLEPTKVTMLGATVSNGYGRWSDYTTFDYSNFGQLNEAMGQCVSMALTNDFVDVGQWISSSCNPTNYFNTVCKKNFNNTCDVQTNQSPAKCSKAIFLNNAGVIYSPSYPNSGPNTCEYVITQKSGFNASVTFTQSSLDKSSNIQLYNSIYDTVPFNTFTGSNNNQSLTFSSKTNTLVFKFTTAGGNGNYFRAEYGISGYPLCNDGVLYDQANFTTTNYPNSYPKNTLCEYRLKSSKNRIALVFDDFFLTPFDEVRIYDGNGVQIQYMNGGPTSYALSSFSATMRIVFSTSNWSGTPQGTGFKARFISTY